MVDGVTRFMSTDVFQKNFYGLTNFNWRLRDETPSGNILQARRSALINEVSLTHRKTPVFVPQQIQNVWNSPSRQVIHNWSGRQPLINMPAVNLICRSFITTIVVLLALKICIKLLNKNFPFYSSGPVPVTLTFLSPSFCAALAGGSFVGGLELSSPPKDRKTAATMKFLLLASAAAVLLVQVILT